MDLIEVNVGLWQLFPHCRSCDTAVVTYKFRSIIRKVNLFHYGMWPGGCSGYHAGLTTRRSGSLNPRPGRDNFHAVAHVHPVDNRYEKYEEL